MLERPGVHCVSMFMLVRRRPSLAMWSGASVRAPRVAPPPSDPTSLQPRLSARMKRMSGRFSRAMAAPAVETRAVTAPDAAGLRRRVVMLIILHSTRTACHACPGQNPTRLPKIAKRLPGMAQMDHLPPRAATRLGVPARIGWHSRAAGGFPFAGRAARPLADFRFGRNHLSCRRRTRGALRACRGYPRNHLSADQRRTRRHAPRQAPARGSATPRS